MRVIRFLDDDGRICLGEDHRDGTATVLVDAAGLLDRKQEGRALRELLRGKQALVADDDTGICRTVEEAFTRVGCRTTVCHDGRDAIRALENDSFDVVVSDITMPHHDGYEVFAAAKEVNRRLPVLLITGFGYDPGHKLVRATKEGLEGVLFKPFSPAQLTARLVEAVQLCRGASVGPLVRTTQRIPVGGSLPPIATAEILCVGRNYRLRGEAAVVPEHDDDLELFMKPLTAMQSNRKPVTLPPPRDADHDVAPEGELAVVIGRTVRNVSEADAMEAVFGYTIANDVTARAYRGGTSPMTWMRGKGFDSFCPLGPAIVTRDEIEDPGDLRITMRVNRTVVSEGSTREMIRSVPRLISAISKRMTLRAGVVLLTGAPAALGEAGARVPSLKHGDRVRIEIDGIGVLENPIVASDSG